MNRKADISEGVVLILVFALICGGIIFKVFIWDHLEFGDVTEYVTEYIIEGDGAWNSTWNSVVGGLFGGFHGNDTYVNDTCTCYVLNWANLTDHSGCGLFANFTVGENVVAGDVLFMNSSGKYWKAKASTTSFMPVTAMATGSYSADSVATLLLEGYYRDDSWSWTNGSMLFVSNTTFGGLIASYPSGSGQQVEVVGYAVDDDWLYFKPNLAVVEIE